MRKMEYRARGGVTQFKPVLTKAELSRVVFNDNNEGWCVGCGEFHIGVEPDATRYDCELCGANKVYGLEQLLMMNLIEVEEEK